MKIYSEISLENFEAWSGGADTLCLLTHEQCEQLESIIEEVYPDGMSETELNDLLWFEDDTIAEWLGFENFEALKKFNDGDDDEEEKEDDEEEEDDGAPYGET